jgi:hypothetical protein
VYARKARRARDNAFSKHVTQIDPLVEMAHVTGPTKLTSKKASLN